MKKLGIPAVVCALLLPLSAFSGEGEAQDLMDVIMAASPGQTRAAVALECASGGEVGKQYQAGGGPEKCFDGIVFSRSSADRYIGQVVAASGGGTGGAYVQIAIPARARPDGVCYQVVSYVVHRWSAGWYSRDRAPTAWTLEGSVDGVSWTPIDARENVVWSGSQTANDGSGRDPDEKDCHQEFSVTGMSAPCAFLRFTPTATSYSGAWDMGVFELKFNVIAVESGARLVAYQGDKAAGASGFSHGDGAVIAEETDLFAPATATKDGIVYGCRGSVFETWQGQRLVSSVTNAATTFHYVPDGEDHTLTWLWAVAGTAGPVTFQQLATAADGEWLVSGTKFVDGYGPEKCFDGVAYTDGLSDADGATYRWISRLGGTVEIGLRDPLVWRDVDARLGQYRLYQHSAGYSCNSRAPTAWTLEGSADGETWTVLDTVTDFTWVSQSDPGKYGTESGAEHEKAPSAFGEHADNVVVRNVDADRAYAHYRFTPTASRMADPSSDTATGLMEIEFLIEARAPDRTALIVRGTEPVPGVSPDYGTHIFADDGDTIDCTAPAAGVLGGRVLRCRGYVLETRADDGSWGDPVTNLDARVFSSAKGERDVRLTWLWERIRMEVSVAGIDRPRLSVPLTASVADDDSCTFRWVRKGTPDVVVAETAEYVPTAADLEHWLCAVVSLDGVEVGEKSFYFSRLPVLYLSTDSGLEIIDKENYVPARLRIQGNEEFAQQYDGATEVKGRGNSSWTTFAQRPYKLKLDKKTNLFGYGKQKHWVLISCFADNAFMRNRHGMELAKEVGVAGMDMTWVAVVLNGRYYGVEMLSEHIRVDANRIDVFDWESKAEEVADALYDAAGAAAGWTKSDKSAIEEKMSSDFSWITTGEVAYGVVAYRLADYGLKEDWNLTGGYLYEMEDRYDEPSKFLTALKRTRIQFSKPEFAATDVSMFAAAQKVWNDVEAAYLSVDHYSPDGEKPLSELADLDSMAGYWLTLECLGNVDCCAGHSRYSYVDVDGKLVFGPVWDFDYGGGSITVQDPVYGHASLPDHWAFKIRDEMPVEAGRAGTCFFVEWMDDPLFVAKAYGLYWRKVRPWIAAELAAGGGMDEKIAYLAEAGDAHDALYKAKYGRWGFGGANGDVAKYRAYLTARLAWLDRQFASVDTLMAALVTENLAKSAHPYEKSNAISFAVAGGVARNEVCGTDFAVATADGSFTLSVATTEGSAASADVYLDGVKCAQVALANGAGEVPVGTAGVVPAVEGRHLVSVICRDASGAVVERSYATVLAGVTPGTVIELTADNETDARAQAEAMTILLSAEDLAAGVEASYLRMEARPYEDDGGQVRYRAVVAVNPATVPAPVLGEDLPGGTEPMTVVSDADGTEVGIGVVNATRGLWYGCAVTDALGKPFQNDLLSFKRATGSAVTVRGTKRTGAAAFYRVKVLPAKPVK